MGNRSCLRRGARFGTVSWRQDSGAPVSGDAGRCDAAGARSRAQRRIICQYPQASVPARANLRLFPPEGAQEPDTRGPASFPKHPDPTLPLFAVRRPQDSRNVAPPDTPQTIRNQGSIPNPWRASELRAQPGPCVRTEHVGGEIHFRVRPKDQKLRCAGCGRREIIRKGRR
jgi:hypothetical protein